MNKLAFGAALAALSLALPGVAQAQRTPGAVIVVVDTDRIYRECTACRAAQTTLQGQVTSARTRATQLGQPLQTEAQSIEQAGAALRNQTGAARTAAETALTARMQQFQTRQTAALLAGRPLMLTRFVSQAAQLGLQHLLLPSRFAQ